MTPERADPCRLSVDGVESLDTFTVILSDPVDLSHDPIPSNQSEQLLFAQQFETLVRLDCNGQLRPGLAEEWTSDRTGRVWTFVVPDNRTRDGALEPATRVASSWRTRDTVMRELGIESVAVRGRDSLVVKVNPMANPVPSLFADPGLAVPRLTPAPGDSGNLRFRVEPGGDLRDALDRGGDLLVTRDPALLDYLAGRPELVAFPLPWTRTYVLVQPASAEPLAMVEAEEERRSLARDAVSADARAAEPPFWWAGAAECSSGETPNPIAASSRVVYPRGDPVAQGLAERIVALAGAGTGLRAAALDPAHFKTQLKDGSERAYVMPLPRQTLAPCRELAALPEQSRLQPLIDTRAHVVVRKGAPPLTVEWDGTVRLAPR